MSHDESKVGRPSKYEQRFDDMAVNFGKQGYTHLQIACEFEVCESTLYEWAKHHPSFSKALTRAKEESLKVFTKKLFDNLDNDKFNAKLSEIFAKYVLNLSTSRKLKFKDRVDFDAVTQQVESGELSAQEANEVADLLVKAQSAKKAVAIDMTGCSTIQQKIGRVLEKQESGEIDSSAAKALLDSYKTAAQIEEQCELKRMVYELQQKLES